LFTLSSFWEITTVTRIFGYSFPQVRLCINFGENELGDILGDLVTLSGQIFANRVIENYIFEQFFFKLQK
jgi:hypothetical protein